MNVNRTKQRNLAFISAIYSKYKFYIFLCIAHKLLVPGIAFCPKDKEFWIKEGTWRIPPIIIDVKSIGKVPLYSDISADYQLVEGHSRLGYLLAMNRAGEPLSDLHVVYMLRNKKM